MPEWKMGESAYMYKRKRKKKCGSRVFEYLDLPRHYTRSLARACRAHVCVNMCTRLGDAIGALAARHSYSSLVNI